MENNKKKCSYIPGRVDKGDIYKLPKHKKEIQRGVYKYNIFKTFRSSFKNEKVIMMVGATGVGKTTLINRMINYIFGVNYTDTFRFQLVEETGASEIKSRTTDIHKYTIHLKNFPYKITIIDTPGISSTKGKTEDKRTLEKIKDLFESGKIEAVDAICIVEKYGTQRLNENQTYIFQTIAQIFGEDVDEVIFIMSTCCEKLVTANPKPPTVLEMFEEEEIPYKEYYLFNNDDIYARPTTDTSLEAQTATEYWNKSTTSFRFFFERLESTTPISLRLTKEILQKKYHIKTVLLPYLIRTLKSHIHEIEAIEEDMKIIEQMIQNPDTSKFTKIIKVTKTILEDITEPNQFSTRCKTCDVICHYPCDIQENNYILKSTKWCSAMTWFNLQFSIHCTVCDGKCSWKDHEQIKKKAVFKTIEEPRTDESLKESYMKDRKGKIGSVKKQCKEKILLAYNKVLKDFKDIQNGIDFINEHSLSKKPTTIKDYIDDVIELEEEAKEDGYNQRIHCLKKLVEMNGKLSPSKDVQKAKAFIEKMQDL